MGTYVCMSSANTMKCGSPTAGTAPVTDAPRKRLLSSTTKEVSTVSPVRKLVGTVSWGRRSGDLLVAQVRAELDAAGGSEITVRVQDGVVSLRGEVDDLRDISRYEAVARQVPGVIDVDNLLRLHLTGVAVRPRILSA